MERNDQKVHVTGLWIQKSKDGKSYLTGPWGSLKILIFKNEKKSGETQPDYYFTLAESPRKKPQAKTETFEEEDVGF